MEKVDGSGSPANKKAPGEAGAFLLRLGEIRYSVTTLTKVCCSTPFLRNCTRPSALANKV